MIGSESRACSASSTRRSAVRARARERATRKLAAAGAGGRARARLRRTRARRRAPTAASRRPPACWRCSAGARAVNVSLVPTASSIALDADALAAAQAAAAVRRAARIQHAGRPGARRTARRIVARGRTGQRRARRSGATSQGLTRSASLLERPDGRVPGAKVQGISVKGLLEGILAPLSVLGEQQRRSQARLQSWMGSAGLFASGTGLARTARARP